MLDYTLIIARIKAQAPAFRIVAGALNLEGDASDALAYPSASVLPLQVKASPNNLINAVDQEMRERFACRIGVRNLTDRNGEAAYGELSALVTSVRSALLGYMPGTDYYPLESAGGRLVRVADRIVWWDEFFETRTHVRAV